MDGEVQLPGPIREEVEDEGKTGGREEEKERGKKEEERVNMPTHIVIAGHTHRYVYICLHACDICTVICLYLYWI